MTGAIHPAWRASLGAVAVALLACVLTAGDWLWRADAAVYDGLLATRSRAAPGDIVIVAIDDRSLSQLGQWPWPRSTHAALIDALGEGGAAVVVFNVAVIERGVPDDDARLVAAVKRNGHVVLPVLLEQGPFGAPIEALPIPELVNAAAGLGHVDVDVDPDGVSRSVFLYAGIGGPRWPALALAGLAVSRPDRATLFRARAAGPAPSADYAWVRAQRVLVGYAGPPGHYRQVSAVDVLRHRLPSEFLRGAAVLVGVTAAGIDQGVHSPVSAAASPLSGIEWMASVFDGLREGDTSHYLDSNRAMVWSAALAAMTTTVTGAVPGSVALLLGVTVPLLSSVAALVLWGAWFGPAAAVAAAVAGASIRVWLSQRTRHRLSGRDHQHAVIALGSVDEAVITIDAHERIDYLNVVARQWLGEASATAVGRPMMSVMQLVDEQLQPLSCADLAARGRVEGFLLGPDQRRIRGSAVPIRDWLGEPQGQVIALADAASTQPDPATYDRLTGLPGRAFMRHHLAAVLEAATSSGQRGAVLVLDVERLRDVNIALGRDAGDRLLRAIAARLRQETAGHGSVGRIGGGEFVIVYDDLRLDEDASALGARILQAFVAPVHLDGKEVRVNLSLGVSLFAGEGGDPDSLIQHADTAMRSEPGAGMERSVRVYQHQMGERSRDRVALTRALQVALECRTLSLAYQPIVNLRNGVLVGVEALARWRDVEHGSIPPSTFVPLAEETGLIDQLGDWTLREACRQTEAWDALGVSPFWVSVNVSPRQFLRPTFAPSVQRAVADSRLSPSRLMLEITESTFHDVRHAVSILEQVKSTGITVALDDFGVGYSSLSHLKNLPVDVVKIDRSFVSGVDVDGPDRTICLAMLSLAESLDRRVVAEGVETASQADFLRSKGCREVQGFYVGRPVAPATIAHLAQVGSLLGPAAQANLPFS